MGARLVTLVLTRWTHVNDRAFRALVRMAHTALDERSGRTPAAVYFGGHDLLAMTFRSERGGNLETLERTVKRAIADLVKEGAIERLGSSRSGHNAVYQLTLDGARHIDQLPVDIGPPKPSVGDTSGPPVGDTSGPPVGDTSGPPIEEPLEEPSRSYGRTGETRDLRTAVTAVDTHAPTNDTHQSHCPRHTATRLRAGRCRICHAQAPRQPPLLQAVSDRATA